MKIVRMYTGKDGKTHFEETKPALKAEGKFSTADLIKVGGAPILRLATGTMPEDHTAPRRQYLVMLEGRVDVISTNGTRRTLETGDILQAEDVTGEGHLVTMNGCQKWAAVMVPMA